MTTQTSAYSLLFDRRQPVDFAYDMLKDWEKGYQAHPEDTGNWVGDCLLGTKYGVTPATLALFRGVDPETLTVQDMKNLTFQEASRIALDLYYYRPGLDALPWAPATEACADFAYHAGPGRAVRTLQSLCGTTSDGIVGQYTVKAYTEWLAHQGPKGSTEKVRDARRWYYKRIVQLRPKNRKFLNGWLRRADAFSYRNAKWWAKWFV